MWFGYITFQKRFSLNQSYLGVILFQTNNASEFIRLGWSCFIYICFIETVLKVLKFYEILMKAYNDEWRANMHINFALSCSLALFCCRWNRRCCLFNPYKCTQSFEGSFWRPFSLWKSSLVTSCYILSTHFSERSVTRYVTSSPPGKNC